MRIPMITSLLFIDEMKKLDVSEHIVAQLVGRSKFMISLVISTIIGRCVRHIKIY
jgi:hypothetical protein